jgi:peptidoglycan/LPS O-acetylase OafA/YrhL
MATTERSFVTLDGLRGLAAIAIVLWHADDFFGRAVPEAYLAVDFFFALSGFVLAHAYEERLRKGMSTADFMTLRLVRLYPLYFLALALWLPFGLRGLALGNVHPRQLVIDLTTALLFLPSPASGLLLFPTNGPAWSLFLELIVNAWLGIFGARSGNVALGTLCAVMAIGEVIAATMTVPGLSGGWTWNMFWIGVIRVSYSFPAGILIYRLWRTHKPTVHAPAVVIAIVLFAILAAPVPARYEGEYAASAAIVGFPALILFGASSYPRSHIASLCTRLGAISYAIYVLHVPVSTWVLRIAEKTSGLNYTRWLWGVVSVGTIILAADVASRRFDRPVRIWLTMWLERRSGWSLT